jgi:parallel beta-helix repeat protein
VDAALPGDVVYVYNGTYYENVEITKTLTLTGEDRDTTIIEGGGSRDVIRVTSDWVNVTGFALFGSDFVFQYAGLALSYVQHCHIADNLFRKNDRGISIHESHDNTGMDNVFTDNGEGITISRSNDNTIEDNLIIGHLRAIDIYSSQRDVIRNNTMLENSIMIEGDSVEHWNTHVIETSNTVNGKPVHYWKDVNGGTVPAGAGEIILANCTSVLVENQAIHNGSVGIELGFTTDITIANNNISARISGITSYYSARNWIRANEVRNSGSGVRMYFSNDTDISWLNATNGGYGISFWHCVNNTIKNGTFSGNGGGMEMDYSSGNTIVGNSVTSSVQVGLYIRQASNRNNVTENTITSNTRPGIQMGYAFDNEVHNNTISSNVGGGVYVYDSDGNVFRSNDLYENDGFGIFLRDSDGNEVADNNISAAKGTIPDGFGIGLNGSNDNALVRNQLWYNQYGALSVWHSDGNRIVENTISRNHFGVDVWYSRNTTIEDNDISENSAVGVYLTFSENGRIVDNRLATNYMGIVLDESENVTVSRNDVRWNNWSGIFADGVPSGHLISGNEFSHNERGIVFRYQYSNIVSDNTVSYNNRSGIYLYGSGESTIAYNLVMQNGIGFNLTSSSNNTVFHNTIVDNGEQAHDNRNDNQWDNGYPSGGNYWSDYNGTDNRSGPNQDQPGHDHIGDTAYVIDVDSRDRYPLMNTPVEFNPRPPTIVEAHLSGNGFENVTVRWLLSPDDGAGMNSVDLYDIWRGSVYDANGAGYLLVGSVAEGIDTYVDVLAGEGDTSSYFYTVTAITATGHGAASRTHAGKFTRPLAPGPNLISFPLIQSNESVRTVLQTVAYDGARSYDGEWDSFMQDKTYFGGLSDLNHTMGVWVNVTRDCNFTVAGVVPAQTVIHLNEGWNLVSYPSLNPSYPVADLKAETGATRVEGYDLAPPYFLRVLGDAEALQPGYGYWVKVEADSVWTAPFP